MLLTDKEVVRLLDKLCTKLGFCLAPESRNRIRTQPPAEVESFTDTVIIAEGLDPIRMDSSLRRRVMDEVAQAFIDSDRAEERSERGCRMPTRTLP